MKKIWWLLGTLVLLFLLFYAGGSYYFSSVLIASETQSLAESIVRLEAAGIDRSFLPEPENVSIANGEVTLAGWYYDNPAEGDCAVLLLHGYRSTRMGALQYAPLFWDRGCDLLAYDARGHGDSSAAYHTYGYFEKEDGTAVYNWLLTETGLSTEQVGVLGVSYGAATALQMLPSLDPAFVIADSSYQDFRTIITTQAVAQFGNVGSFFLPGAFFVSELRSGMDVDAVSPRNAVVGVETPILLTHSLQDAFTAPENSKGIYANANQERTVLQINDWGAAHARDVFARPDEYAEMVDGFLAEFVPEFGN